MMNVPEEVREQWQDEEIMSQLNITQEEINTMDTPQQNIDWRGDITESKSTLKVKDGDVVEITFADEGTKKVSADYGTSVAFSVLLKDDKEPKLFYVKANNFDLLGQIKVLGTLTGVKARISRIGSTKSNTRYKIVKL
jgi:hypothetical protein